MSAYWVVRVAVRDSEKLAAYAPLAAETVATYGGRYLARGGAHESTEGTDYPRNVIVEWPDMETAQKPITVRNTPMLNRCWEMGLTDCL